MTGKDVKKAAELLSKGKLVAIPTETVYGLAACIDNNEAILSIFHAKNRPAFDPLIVHIADLNWLDFLVSEIPEKAKRFMEVVWPGPVTLLFRKSDQVSDLVTSGNPTVAIRFPSHPMSLEMLRLLGKPVAAPSANPFGYVSPTEAAHVENQLGEKVSYILDGGPCRVGLESTIVSFVNEPVEVLRLGGMSLETLEKYLGEKPVLKISTHSNPQAPGQLDKHYATSASLILSDDIIEDFLENRQKLVGLISFQNGYPDLAFAHREVLSPDGNADEAASRLFAAMRRLDESGVEVILAERFPDEGLGRAINDRLHRASHRKP
ncbi:MAG: threonylcarbamoyl-AMP synthase [Bacteroidetes bacterium]|nr:threonylcarbamoyl-AMP synthase [Bacteroidota bacterium]